MMKLEANQLISDGTTYGPFTDGRHHETGYMAGPESEWRFAQQGCRITNTIARYERTEHSNGRVEFKKYPV